MAKSLTLNLVNDAASYDPMSPSYDPDAASPCNPFPTTSPFVPVTFKKPQPPNPSSLRSSLIAAVQQPIPPAPRPIQLPLLPQVPPAHSAPSLRRTKPCRFYLDVRGCKSGRWCNFKHPVDARPTSDTAAPKMPPAEGWEGVPDVRDLNPDWGKEKDGEVHPKFRTQPCKNYLLGLCRFGERCQFIHPPEIIAHLPVYPASVPLDYFTLAAPTPCSKVIPPVVSTEDPANAPKHQSVPCTNFEMDGECSHGNKCQFIHKPKTTARRFKVVVKNNSKTAPVQDKKDGETDVDSKPPRTRPVKKKTGAIKEASGIHKPTWRVVGGGVPLAIEVPNRGAPKRQSSIMSSSQGSTTGSQSPVTLASSPSPSTVSLPTPEEYLSIDPSLADLSQYDFATPTHFKTQTDFLRPPSPDVPLDITMGSPELFDFPAHLGPRKRVRMTGDDIIRQMREGSLDEFDGSPNSRREKYRSKPQLTIHVPSLRKSRSSIDIVKGNPGKTPFPHTTRHSVGPDEMEPVAELSEHHAGDFAGDWPEDLVDEEEQNSSAQSYAFCVVDVIQRPHSTPPTPWSGSSIQVPLLPRLPAESP